MPLPPTPPFSHRVIVATIATLIGGYIVYDTGRDFEFIKFTPHLREEVERRKKEGNGVSVKLLESCTLDLTPEAKQKYAQRIAEENKKREENK